MRKVLDELEVSEKFRPVVEEPEVIRPLKHAGGRPSSYTIDKGKEICDWIASGELLIELLQREGMPSMSSVFRWLDAHPEFREAYARARELQAHACAERGLRESRGANAETANAARVRFDGERWFAGKLLARVYGDKVDLNHAGAVDHHLIPEDRLNARLVELLGKDGTVEALGREAAATGKTKD